MDTLILTKITSLFNLTLIERDDGQKKQIYGDTKQLALF